MQAAVAKNDSGKMDMIVKRVSVPIGLEELMEGLTKEVLLKKPKDLYVFASEYFSRLVVLRERGSHKAYTVRTMQSVTHLRSPDTSEKTKVPLPRPTKHISRQISTQSKTPAQPKASQVRKGIQKSVDRKPKEKNTKEAVRTPSRRDRSKESTPSVESTPREKRQRSTSRQTKPSVGDSRNSTERSKSLKIQGRNKSDKKAASKPCNIRSDSETQNRIDNALKGITKTTTTTAAQPLDSDIWAATTNVQTVTKLIDEKKETKKADNKKNVPEIKDIETEKRKSPEGKEDIECPSPKHSSNIIERKSVDKNNGSATFRSKTVEPSQTGVVTGSVDEDLAVKVEKEISSQTADRTENTEQKSIEKSENSVDYSGCSGKEELNSLDSKGDKQGNIIASSDFDKKCQDGDTEKASVVTSEADSKAIFNSSEASTTLDQPDILKDNAKEVSAKTEIAEILDNASHSKIETTESKTEHTNGEIHINAEDVMKTAQTDGHNVLPQGGDEQMNSNINNVQLESGDSTSDNKDSVSEEKKSISIEDDDNKKSGDNVKLLDNILPQGNNVNKDASSKEDLNANKDDGKEKSEYGSVLEKNKSLNNKGAKESTDSGSDQGLKKDLVVSEGGNEQKHAFDSEYAEHKKNNEEPDAKAEKEAGFENKIENVIDRGSERIKNLRGDNKLNKELVITGKYNSTTDEAQSLSSAEQIAQVETDMEDKSGTLKSSEENQYNNETVVQNLDDVDSNSSLKDGEKGSFPGEIPKDTSSKERVGEVEKIEIHHEGSPKHSKENDKKEVQIKMEQMGQSDDVLTISILENPNSSEDLKSATHDVQDKSKSEDVKEDPESKKVVDQQVSLGNTQGGEKRQFFPKNEELVSEEGDKIEDHVDKGKLDEKVNTNETKETELLLKTTDNSLSEGATVMSDIVLNGDHITKAKAKDKSEVTKEDAEDEVKTSIVSTDSISDKVVTTTATVGDVDKETSEEKYAEENKKNEDADSEVQTKDNEVTRKIVNHDMADEKTGRVHTPVRTLLSSFLASEKQHVFKTTDVGAGQDIKVEGTKEKTVENIVVPAFERRIIKDEPFETVENFEETAEVTNGKSYQKTDNKTESESILKQPPNFMEVTSEVPSTKNEDSLMFGSVKGSLDLSSSQESTEASNSLKLIIKETDSSDGNTNTQSVITDSAGYRKRRSITIDETNETQQHQASSSGICDLPSSETVADAPSITEISAEARNSKNLESISHFNRDQNEDTHTLQSEPTLSEIRLESGSNSFSGDKRLSESKKEVDNNKNISSVINSQDIKTESGENNKSGDKKDIAAEVDKPEGDINVDPFSITGSGKSDHINVTSAKEGSDRKNTLEQAQPSPLTVDAEIEMSSLESGAGKGISKEDTFIKSGNKSISGADGVSNQVASVIEAVRNIYNAHSITDKSSVGAAKEFLNNFLQNEQQHVFRNADAEQCNNLSDTKMDSEMDKKVKSKLTFGSKQEKSQSHANLLTSETEISNIDDNRMRRARSVGIMKIGEHESKSKIPTPVRRSAGRRPLVRQLDADSKELEEKLNFKRSSSGSSKENDAKASSSKQKGNVSSNGFKETKLIRDDALIAKTILKGVEGAEKHIELIDDHLNKSQTEDNILNKSDYAVCPPTHQNEVKLSSKEDNAFTKAEEFDKDGKETRNQPKVENDEMEMDSLEIIQDDKKQHDAATKIQKNWRGFHARRQLDQSNTSPRDPLESGDACKEPHLEVGRSENDNSNDEEKSGEFIQSKGNVSNENDGKDNKNENGAIDGAIEISGEKDSKLNGDDKRHMDSNVIIDNIATEKVVTNNIDRTQSNVQYEAINERPHVDTNVNEDMLLQMVSIRNEEVSKIGTDSVDIKGSKQSEDECGDSESKKDDLKETAETDQTNKIEQKHVTADDQENVVEHVEASSVKDENKVETVEKYDSQHKIEEKGNNIVIETSGRDDENIEKEKHSEEDGNEQIKTVVKVEANTTENVGVDTSNAVSENAKHDNNVKAEKGKHIEPRPAEEKGKTIANDELKIVEKFESIKTANDTERENKYEIDEKIKKEHIQPRLTQEEGKPKENELVKSLDEFELNKAADADKIGGIDGRKVYENKGNGKSDRNNGTIEKEKDMEAKPCDKDNKSVENNQISTSKKFDINKSVNVDTARREDSSNRVSESQDSRKADENFENIEKGRHIKHRPTEEVQRSIENHQLETIGHNEFTKSENIGDVIEDSGGKRVIEDKDNTIDQEVEIEQYTPARPSQENEKFIESDQSKSINKFELDKSASADKRGIVKIDRISDDRICDKNIENAGKEKDIDVGPSEEDKKSTGNDQIRTAEKINATKSAIVESLSGEDMSNRANENRHNGVSNENVPSVEKEKHFEPRSSGGEEKSIENDQRGIVGEVESSESANFQTLKGEDNINRENENKDKEIDQKTRTGERIQPKPSEEHEKSVENDQIRTEENFDANNSAKVESLGGEDGGIRVSENKNSGKSDGNGVNIEEPKHIDPRPSEGGEKSFENDQPKIVGKVESSETANIQSLNEEGNTNRVSENKDKEVDQKMGNGEIIQPKPKEEDEKSVENSPIKTEGNFDANKSAKVESPGEDGINRVSENKDSGKSDENGVNIEEAKHIEPRPSEKEGKSIENIHVKTVGKDESGENANIEGLNEEDVINRVDENKDKENDLKIGKGENIQARPSEKQEKPVDNHQVKTEENVEVNKSASVDKLSRIDERDSGKSDKSNTEKEKHVELMPSGQDKKPIENDPIKSLREFDAYKSTNVDEISEKQTEFSSREAEGHIVVHSNTGQDQDTQQPTEVSQLEVNNKNNQTEATGLGVDDETYSGKISGKNNEEFVETNRNTLLANTPSKGSTEQADVSQNKNSEGVTMKETGGTGGADRVAENVSQTDARATKGGEANLGDRKQSAEEAAVKIQSAWRGFVARKLMKTSSPEDPTLKSSREQAVVKIQAIVRGFLDRMRVEKLKSPNLKVKKSDKNHTFPSIDDTVSNSFRTLHMPESVTSKEKPEQDILSSKGEEGKGEHTIAVDSGPSQSEVLKRKTFFDNSSVEPQLEGKQILLNTTHKGEIDVDDAVNKFDESETNKYVIDSEVIKAPESEYPAGSSNSINKDNMLPADDTSHTSEEKYQSEESSGLDSTHVNQFAVDSIKATSEEPENKSNTVDRPKSVHYQSNDLEPKSGNVSKTEIPIGASSKLAKDTQALHQENDSVSVNQSSNEKTDFYRSNTVEEPVCIPKHISHLGEDSDKLPDEHPAATTDQKDDNNNSSKEETQLEKEVRSAVHNIMSDDKNNSKYLTLLEAEVSHAVKQIIKHNDINDKTNREEKTDPDKMVPNIDNATIDTILKQLPEVPVHEVPKTIVKQKDSSSNLEQHTESYESQKANEEDSVKENSSKASVERPLSSKTSTTKNIKLANVGTCRSSASLDAPDDRSSVGSVDSVVTVIMKPKSEGLDKQDAIDAGTNIAEHELEDTHVVKDNVSTQNKRLTSKALSTSALEDHVELIDQVQNSLLDQLSGKAVDSSKKIDIEELRKELHSATTLYKGEDGSSPVGGQDPEVMHYLYDFEPEDDYSYDSRMVRTPLRDLPDIAEETESKEEDTHTRDKGAQHVQEHFCGTSELNLHAQASNSAAELINPQSEKAEDHQKLLRTSDTIVIPVSSLSSETAHSGASRDHNIADLGKLKHTSEFHDTVVVPLPKGTEPKMTDESKNAPPAETVETSRQANTMDSGNQTSIQQPPAGVEAVTSRRRPQDGVDVVKAQASLKDTSSAKLESGESFTHQSPPQSPRTAEQDMESENNNNKRNNAINQSVTADEKNMEVAAATKIQAGFRGYQVRKQLKAKNTALDQKRQLRKRSSRENMKDPELEEKSAVKIQAGVRGFLVRRRQKKQINSSASA